MDNKTRRSYYPDKFRGYHLKAKYNMSLEDYNKLYEEQRGCCSICKTRESKLNKKLFVDHCHTTNKIRGLLCHHCNAAIGMLKDDIQIMYSAIKYIVKHAQ